MPAMISATIHPIFEIRHATTAAMASGYAICAAKSKSYIPAPSNWQMQIFRNHLVDGATVRGSVSWSWCPVKSNGKFLVTG